MRYRSDQFIRDIAHGQTVVSPNGRCDLRDDGAVRAHFSMGTVKPANDELDFWAVINANEIEVPIR
jgi:hypothetical protein